MTPAEMQPLNAPAPADGQAATESNPSLREPGALNAPEHSPAQRAAGLAPQIQQRIISALLLLIASILGMVLLSLIGFQRFQGKQQMMLHDRQTTAPRLHYGQRLADLRVQTSWAHHATARLSTFGGKWLALVLISAGCDACDLELRSLAAIYPGHQNRLTVLPVLLGGPHSAPGLLQGTADLVKRRLRLPFPVGLDTAGSLLTLTDRPLITPFCVLIDPNGLVRYSAVGSDPSYGTTQFASLVRARLDGPGAVRTLRWHEPAESDMRKAPIAPDGVVALPTKRAPVTLSSLFSPEITVVTFLRGNPRLTAERLASLRRFAETPSNVRMIYLYSDVPDASLPDAVPTAAVVGRAGEDLFHRYDVGAGPRSFVIARKHLLLGESSVTQSSYAIRSALDQYFLLHG